MIGVQIANESVLSSIIQNFNIPFASISQSFGWVIYKDKLRFRGIANN
jgi:hypothetical protein